MSDRISEAIELAEVEPIAAIVVGSFLYNTQIVQHDVDVALFVPQGKSMQFMDGDLDVRVIPLELMLAPGTKGFLYETDAMLGLLYGRGTWYDHPWKPVLQMFRPSIYQYANTVRRFKVKNPEAQKHIVRYDIFLRRWWETGNANPRLTDDERTEWYEKLYT